MDKSLNCSVYFNPIYGEKKEKSKSNNPKEENKQFKPKVLPSDGSLFSIKYVPEQFRTSPIKFVARTGRNGIYKGGYFPGSSVEIEEFISPYTSSPDGLQMHYVIDEQVRCRTCLEMKHALDFTFEKLYRQSFKIRERGEKRSETQGNEPSEVNYVTDALKDQYCFKRKQKFCTTPVIKQIEESGPLMQFFSRLVRAATMEEIKKFSKDVEEKVPYFKTVGAKGRKMFQVVITRNETQGVKRKVKKPSQIVDACKSCQRLQQAVYITVKKLYEDSGVKTDFPTVQTLETYAFLVYPSEMDNLPAFKNNSVRKSRKRRATSAPEERTEIHKHIFRKARRIERKKTKEELEEEKNEEIMTSRIKRHKEAFASSNYIHVIVAMGISFMTILLIFMNWLTEQQTYTKCVLAVMVALLFGCLYNAYLMVFDKSYSFKYYVIIPICWIFLAFSNGKCNNPTIPNNVCDPNIHFMSHIYLLIVLMEYYVASGIHAIVVLEINMYQRLPTRELLKYSAFNLPLMIISLVYALVRKLLELRMHYKKKSYGARLRPENLERGDLN